MTPLESEYPATLNEAVEHAARFSRALSAPNLMTRLDRWAIGRVDEISRFVELVVGDWRSGALSEQAATMELESYVRTLESGLRAHLDIQASLPPAAIRLAPSNDNRG
jgi:hypothetical protein